MTTIGSAYGAIKYSAESAFGEDVDTCSLRIPIINRVDLSGIQQSLIEPGNVKQRMNDGVQHILGAWGGSFTTEFMLAGAGGSCSGAVPTATELITLLGIVFGNTAASASSGTTLTGGTATVPTTTASGTFSAGSMCRVGALQDGDGEGQAYAIATHVTTNLTLLNGLLGAPVNGAVMYTGRMVYPSETAGTAATVSSVRMQLFTANEQILCHGVYPTGATLTGLSAGENPKLSITWGVAWAESKASTFPITETTDTAPGMTTAGGSLFFNAAGTATSALKTARQFELNINMNVVPLLGTGGVNNYQSIVGCRRIGLGATMSWVEDAGVASTTPTYQTIWETDDTSRLFYHACYTLNTRNGGSFGVYFPRLRPIGQRPMQMDVNGVNCIKPSFEALTSTVTTSELTLSSFRFYFG